MTGYVLPGLGHQLLVELTPSDVATGKLSCLAWTVVRYVKNIISGSFRAMVRDAMTDGIITRSAFAALKWPKPKTPEPIHSRARSASGFWVVSPPTIQLQRRSVDSGTSPSVASRLPCLPDTLFWTGLRPRGCWTAVRDIDLDRGRLHVRRSRHLWQYGDPKTGCSSSTWSYFLRRCGSCGIQPLRVEPELPVFSNTVGKPIEPNSLLPHWYACQRALGIRVRGLYSTKDTLVSAALNAA